MSMRSSTWLLFLEKALMRTESELRICSFCIMQAISRGKVLENLFRSSAVATVNVPWSQQLPWHSPCVTVARDCPAHLSLPTTGATTTPLLPTTFNSPASQHGSSWQTQNCIGFLSGSTQPSYWKGAAAAHWHKPAAFHQPSRGTGAKRVLCRSSCHPWFLHGK